MGVASHQIQGTGVAVVGIEDRLVGVERLARAWGGWLGRKAITSSLGTGLLTGDDPSEDLLGKAFAPSSANQAKPAYAGYGSVGEGRLCLDSSGLNRPKRLFEKPKRVSNYTYGVG